MQINGRCLAAVIQLYEFNEMQVESMSVVSFQSYFQEKL